MVDFNLAPLWAFIIIFGIMMYVVLDGFDLGIGILYPFVKNKTHKKVMKTTIMPIWDGNGTWLVFSGAMLFAVFPMAYSVITSALYIPIVLMLFGLIFRGVALELRAKASEAKKHIWDALFMVGSFLAAFFQGVILGAYINGLPVENGSYTGSAFDWIAAFPIFCGISVVIAYALLGCTWLIMKTEDSLHELMYRIVKPLIIILLFVILVISLWTPIKYPGVAERWFSLPNFYWLMPVPILIIVSVIGLLRSVVNDDHTKPFLLALFIIFLGFVGLGISLWPYIVYPSLTIYNSIAPVQSQGILLIGTMFFLPIILGYTGMTYYVFRGKVNHQTRLY